MSPNPFSCACQAWVNRRLETDLLLRGEIPDVANLDARDNTRCTSLLSDVQLDITYTVPPVQETYDLPPVR